MSNFSSNTKMQKPQSNSSNWSDLPRELVGEILRRLNFIDVPRAKSICSHWSSVSPLPPADSQTPWLLIPPKPNPNSRIGKGVSQLYNPADGRLHRTKTLPGEVKTSFLIGSSHGCLIGLTADKAHVPFVLNPLTGTRISLPSIDHLIDDSSSAREGKLQDCITKAVMTTELSQVGSGCAAVVFLYRSQSTVPCDRLAACSISDASWTILNTDRNSYHDVCSNNGKIFVLGPSFSVEIWDSKAPFRKLLTLGARWPELTDTLGSWWWRYYIAMPLVVVRKMDYLRLVAEERYRTWGFDVYKMDEQKEKWVKTESLGENRALFLGQGSHSVSVPATGGIVADCIYYNSEDMVGGDAGVFNLREGEMMKELDDWRGEESARWIVPSL